MALTIQEWLKRPAYSTWLAVGIACRTDVSVHKSTFGKFIYLYSYGNQESKNKKGTFMLCILTNGIMRWGLKRF